MKLMTLDEAAEYLLLNPETLRRMVKAGKAPGRKVGRRWIFRKIDLYKFVGSQIQAQEEKEQECHSSSEETSGGYGSPRQVVNEYKKALGLPTE